MLRPLSEGGQLQRKGQVEVVSSLERDGRPVFKDLRWGVYVVIEAPNSYTADCFRQYGMNTDDSGRYSAMYKPFHLIGLELNISILVSAREQDHPCPLQETAVRRQADQAKWHWLSPPSQGQIWYRRESC